MISCDCEVTGEKHKDAPAAHAPGRCPLTNRELQGVHDYSDKEITVQAKALHYMFQAALHLPPHQKTLFTKRGFSDFLTLLWSLPCLLLRYKY